MSGNIRNFSIIAHIDHGKSTLADRLLQQTRVVSDRELREQMLDNLDIERERGITIKSQTACLPYRSKNGQSWLLNLIDTPGHVDFAYEVSRSLASCEGVLLLVDASQGVEAQTLANLYMALEHNLEVIPVINKVDLPSADIEGVRHQIEHELGLDPDEAILASGKAGIGIEEILEAVVARIPAPKGLDSSPLQALVIDSWYDSFRGVICTIRLFNGSLRPGDMVRCWYSGAVYKVEEVGFHRLGMVAQDELTSGMVGYMSAGIKNIRDVRVGDTLTLDARPATEPLPGFREVQPVVFSSIFPVSTDDYPSLVDAMEKLKLVDASVIFEKDSSSALGFGFRCGFLGLLHLEIVQERLEREFDQSIILTAPSVRYQLLMKNGQSISVDNPAHYPDPTRIESAEEPYIKARMVLPVTYLGALMDLCIRRRGTQVGMNYLDPKRVELIYEMPLAEVIYDFYDKLKSLSKGYASFEYDVIGYRPTELVKVDILVNGEKVDALSMLVYHGNAVARARLACERLKDEIPQQQFKVPIQGAIGGQIIARETISALRKDVTAKCYGGDISRKRKLLDRQKEGKKRMKMVGEVHIPQSAFLAVLKSDES